MVKQNLKQQFNAALLGGNDLPVFLRTCLDLAMLCESNTEIHPIIFVNALKNIIGDNKENPPVYLLEYLYTTIDKIESVHEDNTILNDVGSGGITNPIFIMDMEDAIQEKEWSTAERHAASLFLAAEHKGSVLEILTELGLQRVEHHASFFYHLQRSTIFYQATKQHWTGIKSAINHLKQYPIPEPHTRTPVTPEEIFPQIISVGSTNDIITFAACWRLWELESVRQNGFRREISHWLTTKKNDNHKNSSVEPNPKQKYDNPDYIELAERIIKLELHQNETWHRIAVLEAIRFLWKKSDNKFQSHLSNYIDNLIK